MIAPQPLICPFVVLLVIGAGVAGAGDDARVDLKHLRVEIIYFRQDADDVDRFIDLSTSQDDPESIRSAAGLMTTEQAARVLKAVEADGYFARAKAFGAEPWDPPPRPFFVVQVRTGQDAGSLIELRPADARMLKLVAAVREALVKGAAARSADRAVAAIDPQQRRWPENIPPAPRPVAPTLPVGASDLHPGYTFRAIEPEWEVNESFLKPARGTFVSRATRDMPDDEFPGCFRELEYRDNAKQRVVKSVTLYPSGKVYAEHDSYMHGVDFAQGEAYRRTFAEGGAIVAYVHGKDGQTVDAWSRWPDGSVQRVTDGHGVLRAPTWDPKCYDLAWHYEGLVLLSRTFENDACVGSSLTDNTESGKAAGLTIGRDGSEMLLQHGYMWDQAADGSVTRKTLYRPEEPATMPAEQWRTELVRQYREARRHFNRRFVARANAAGYKLDEMGVASIVADVDEPAGTAGPAARSSR